MLDIMRALAVVLALIGVIWVIQGFGIAPTGSFMDGRPLWGVIGLVCLAGSVAALGYERYRRLRR